MADKKTPTYEFQGKRRLVKETEEEKKRNQAMRDELQRRARRSQKAINKSVMRQARSRSPVSSTSKRKNIIIVKRADTPDAKVKSHHSKPSNNEPQKELHTNNESSSS